MIMGRMMIIRLEKEKDILARTKRVLWTIAICIVPSLLVSQGQALAQDSSATLEEIVVTSRRYEESLNDAPLAVSVMDSQYLADQGINNLGDL